MIHRTPIRVRFAETDQMGIAYHGAYVPWFEVGRVEWLRARGVSYRAMEKDGVSLAVSGLEIDYRISARFDDEIVIETELLEARSRRFAFGYRAVLEDGTVLARAKSIHTPMDANGRAIRLPAKWLAAFGPVEAEAPQRT